MKKSNKLKELILKEYPRLKKEDTFKFECKPGVSCFNRCCNDVNIFLTPYDIIRLKNNLNITSGEFLDKYTILPIDEGLKHPIVMLQMNQDDLNCPFVSSEGCTVYKDRPWSCRMFPIGVASPIEIPDQTEEEFYFLLKEDVCKGFEEGGKQWSIEEWMQNQEVNEYNELGELFKDLSLHDRLLKGKPLEPVKLEMFYMVCYNIDKFREFAFRSTLFKRFDIDETEIDKMRNDDSELLRFGFKFLRFSLFGEKVLKLKDEYLKAVGM